MIPLHDFPAINASLNATSCVFLVTGYALIRARRIALHRACMLAALTTSALFLICYIVYHAQVGSVRFPRYGWVRPVYFTILISHVLLSISVVPLALTSFYFAFTRSFARHRRLNRVFLPIWLYVSVTGVVIFFMLRP